MATLVQVDFDQAQQPQFANDPGKTCPGVGLPGTGVSGEGSEGPQGPGKGAEIDTFGPIGKQLPQGLGSLAEALRNPPVADLMAKASGMLGEACESPFAQADFTFGDIEPAVFAQKLQKKNPLIGLGHFGKECG